MVLAEYIAEFHSQVLGLTDYLAELTDPHAVACTANIRVALRPKLERLEMTDPIHVAEGASNVVDWHGGEPRAAIEVCSTIFVPRAY